MKTSLRTSLVLVKILVLSFIAVSAHSSPLLNGVATHSELGSEQFIAGLYTSTLSESANTILSSQEDKRIQVRVLAPRLSSRRFKRMWIEGMAINASPAELEKYAKDMADFSNMLKVKMVSGDIFSVDRSANGVMVAINGVELGAIDDPQFFDLLLRTWIGPVPLSSEFRESLLKAGSIKPGPLTRFESTKPSDERIAVLEEAFSTRADGDEEPEQTKVAAAKPKVDAPKPKIKPPITAPTAPKLDTPSSDDAQPSDDDTVEEKPEEKPKPVAKPKPKPKPKPVKVATAPKQKQLDDSIFDDDDEDFTAESLLKVQLYYQQVAKYTHKFLEYPQRAWDRGREGNIRLRATIDRAGNVIDAEILDEARYKSLNKAAKKAVYKASPYPAVPEEIKGDDYSFTFRIVFKIN